MPSKSPQKPSAKKAGKSLKEKREAKREKKKSARRSVSANPLSQRYLLPPSPIERLDDYLAAGGGSGLQHALDDRRRSHRRHDHRGWSARARWRGFSDRPQMGVGSRRR